jgi:MFS transporter, UMF1 family
VSFGSIEHVVVLAVTLALCVAAAVVPRRAGPAPGWLLGARALAVVLIGNELMIRVVLVIDRGWRWETDLPLQLSDAALVVAAVALWMPRPPLLAVELTWFWAFSATLQAMITPDLRQGPDDYLFYAFFIAHSGVLIAAAYLSWGLRIAPGPGAVRRVLVASVAWTAIAATGTVLTGGNYMFLREPPPGGSLLDLFGPWPWYLAGAAALAVAIFLLLARLRRADPDAWWRGLGAMSPSGRPGVVMAWAAYDFANTIFSFAVVSFAMSLWTIRSLGAGPGIFWFTVAVSASVLANALLSPVLGAMSDRLGRRRPFLAAFTAVAVGATAAIPLVDIRLGLVLFGVANFSFQASLIYYDAMLATVARPEARGRLSGLGGGLGYAGVLVAGVLLQFTTDADGRITTATFLLTAVLFGLVAAPALALMREEAPARPGAAAEARRPFRRLAAAFAGARRAPGLMRLVVARFFYSDPVNTAIAVMSAFAVAAVGFSEGQALNVLLVLVVVAVAASFAWGRLSDRIGPVPTLLLVLGVWGVGLAFVAGFLAPLPFLLAGAVLGAGVGGMQVVERVVLTQLSPPDRLAEMFGVYGLAGRASAVVGPVVYGAIVAALVEPLGRGAYQIAIVSLMVPLAVGFALAWRLPRAEAAR